MTEKPVKGLSIAKKETFEITLSELKILAPSETKIQLEELQIAQKLKDSDKVILFPHNIVLNLNLSKEEFDKLLSSGILKYADPDESFDPIKILKEQKEFDDGLKETITDLERYKKWKESKQLKEVEKVK